MFEGKGVHIRSLCLQFNQVNGESVHSLAALQERKRKKTQTECLKEKEFPVQESIGERKEQRYFICFTLFKTE